MNQRTATKPKQGLIVRLSDHFTINWIKKGLKSIHTRLLRGLEQAHTRMLYKNHNYLLATAHTYYLVPVG